MKTNGINIIVADSHEEALAIARDINCVSPMKFESIVHLFMNEPNQVYYIILNNQIQAKMFLDNLNVKRGVVSFSGKREFVGFNVDWMKRLLATKSVGKELKKPIKIPQTAEDSGNAFTDLGYR